MTFDDILLLWVEIKIGEKWKLTWDAPVCYWSLKLDYLLLRGFLITLNMILELEYLLLRLIHNCIPGLAGQRTERSSRAGQYQHHSHHRGEVCHDWHQWWLKPFSIWQCRHHSGHQGDLVILLPRRRRRRQRQRGRPERWRSRVATKSKTPNSLTMQRGNTDFLLILPSLREMAYCNSAYKELPLDQSNSSTVAPLSSPHPGDSLWIL